MKAEYYLDISNIYNWNSHTPILAARQLPFYLNSAGHIYVKQNHFSEGEQQDSYLIIHTVSGCGKLKYRDKVFTLKKDHVFFIRCYEYFYYGTDSDDFWEYKWMSFDGSGCESYFNLLNENDFPVIALSDASEVNTCFDEIFRLYAGGDLQKDIKFSFIITRMLTSLLTDGKTPASARKYTLHKDLIEKSIEYMHKNYHKELKIREIAAEVNLNEFYFPRLFKICTGTSPHEYLIKLRINQAKLFLKNSKLTVGGVAAEVGFENVNNFIRDFRKFTGTTPLKYRLYTVM